MAARRNFGMARPRGKAIRIRDPETFSVWLEYAPRGDWACYWEGDLGAARQGFGVPLPARNMAHWLGTMAQRACTDGRVLLLQSRVAPGFFRYYAITRNNTGPVPPAAKGGRAYVAQRTRTAAAASPSRLVDARAA